MSLTPLSPTAHIVAALAYVGGAISGIIVLAAEKKDRFVRFHAMQSTITFLVIAVAHTLLNSLPGIRRVAFIPFVIAVCGLWIALMVLAFMGRTYKLPYIGDFAEQRVK